MRRKDILEKIKCTTKPKTATVAKSVREKKELSGPKFTRAIALAALKDIGIEESLLVHSNGKPFNLYELAVLIYYEPGITSKQNCLRIAEATGLVVIPANIFYWKEIPEFKHVLQIRELKRFEKIGIDPNRILAEDCGIAFADPIGLVDPDSGAIRNLPDIPEDLRRAISSIKVVDKVDRNGKESRSTEYRLSAKGDSLRRLEQHKGLLTEKIEISAGGDLAEALRRGQERVQREKEN